MRLLFVLAAFICSSVALKAQALRDLNYSYLYNVEEPFRFQMNVVRKPDGWVGYYKLHLRDSLANPKDYSITWEVREELGSKEGKRIPIDSSSLIIRKHTMHGSVALPPQTSKVYLTAKVQNTSLKKAWFFYQPLNNNLPIDVTLERNGYPVLDPYVQKNTPLKLSDMGNRLVSYYQESFPASAPPFSESQSKVSKRFKPDSIFQWPSGTERTLSQRGLYLVQKDTADQQGIAFRVEDDYPRLSKVESLADPLVYICTREEFIRVKNAKGDKKAFDKVILGITSDADRASTLFRSYFRRVELANEFFTSYKEGWKTDRGMVFIILGKPDEVYRFEDREVWNYRLEGQKVSMNFVRSSTLFDPDNYVLIRAKRYRDMWYSVIDLWRNARF